MFKKMQYKYSVIKNEFVIKYDYEPYGVIKIEDSEVELQSALTF